MTGPPAIVRNPPSDIVMTVVIVAGFSVICRTHCALEDEMDASRARGLIRDELRLRSALAELEKRRFDVETAQTVRDRVEDLLADRARPRQRIEQRAEDRLGVVDRVRETRR